MTWITAWRPTLVLGQKAVAQSVVRIVPFPLVGIQPPFESVDGPAEFGDLSLAR